jgi:hypothetical protein
MSPRTLAGVLVATILGASSCQWAGDTKAVRVPFADLSRRVEEARSRLESAINEGSADRVPALTRALNAELDAASAQSSAINLLDREHLAINVATARRCLTDMDRYAQSGDLDLLRAQFQQLLPTVAEIRVLLDRAERTTTAK